MAPSSSIRALITRARGGGLAIDTVWGLGFEFATIVGSLLAFTLLGRSLGAEGYGGYASLYAIAGPLVTLSGSGVTLALLQHVVRDHEPIAETSRSCLSISLVLGLLLTALGSAAAFWMVDTLSAIAIVSILFIEFVSTPVVNVAASAVQTDNFVGSAQIRIALVVGRMLIVVALFSVGELTVASLGVGQLAWSVLLAVIALSRVGRRFGFRLLPGRIRRQHLRSNVVYSTAISANALGNEGDKLVLAGNKLVVQTGLYAAAYRVIQLGLVPLGSLVSATHTRFLEGRDGRRRQHLDLALRYSVASGAYGIVFGIAIFVLAPLLPYVIGEDLSGSVTIVRWLAPVVFLRAIGMFSINALMGLGYTGLRTILLTVNAAMAIVLYLILVPMHGWKGAAAGTLICEVLQVVMTWTALVILQRRADRALDEAASGDDDDVDEPVEPTVSTSGDAP